MQAGKLSKGDKLGVVDHATIAYPPFRRSFYIEVPELARMSPAEVDAYRKGLDGIKVRGKAVPKPVKNWNQVRHRRAGCHWLGAGGRVDGLGPAEGGTRA